MLAIENIVDGADLQVNRTDEGLITVSATRVALVKNLSVGNTSASALNGAADFVAALYPIGTSYSDAYPQGVVTGIRAEGVTGEIARVRIIYTTPTFNPNTTPLTLSDETSVVRSTTTVSPKDWTPLSVMFTDPHDSSHNIGPDIIEMEYDDIRRVLVLQGYIRAASLDGYRAGIRKVNSDTFFGLGPGYWKFNRFRSVTPLYNSNGQYTYMITVELETKVELSWASFGILRDTQTGRYVQIRANVMSGLRDKAKNGYQYDIIQTVNGAVLVGLYDMISFAQLFGQGGGN